MNKVVTFTLVNNFKLFSGNMDENSFFLNSDSCADNENDKQNIIPHIGFT